MTLLFLTHICEGQGMLTKNSDAGIFSLGVRSAVGMVNDGKWQTPAFGTGGQFRLKFADRVNSEWFADFLTADLADFGNRTDIHIGWSVMYYLLNKPYSFFEPYVLAGHCFEYLKFSDNRDEHNFAERWSSSIQGGVGTQINLSSSVNVSLSAQYMLHFGTKIAYIKEGNNSIQFLKSKNSGIHDHILIALSINYKIADLW